MENILHKIWSRQILKASTALVFLICFLLGTVAQSQVTTNSGAGLAATYPSLAAAITALNALPQPVSAPVVITLSGNETAPAGGYAITAFGTNVNTITIQGSASTITASAALSSGALTDAIFKLIGADFITLQNFIMQENPANTTTTAGTNNMTEWGVALLYASTTNGAQNNTIQNNTISLNRSYQNTFGIYSNSTHSSTVISTGATATTTAGGNSGLRIYLNNISNVNLGIVVVGPTAAADHNQLVDIGGVAGQGNTITNFGTTGTFSSYVNVSGTVNGILVRNSTAINVSNNTITSSVGGTTSGTLRGIFIPAFSNTPTGTYTNTFNNNIISLQSGIATGAIVGILVETTTATATSVLNINNNNFNNTGHTVAASGMITFISNAMAYLTTAINNNTFTNLTVNTTGSVTFISNDLTRPANGTCNVNNNSIVTGFNKTGAGGTVQFYVSNGTSPTSVSEINNGNNFSNITVTGATTIGGWQNTDGSSTSPFGPSKTVSNNVFSNIMAGSSAVTILRVSYSNNATSNQVSNNTVSNITTTTGSIVAITTIAGTQNLTNNTVNSLSSAGAVAVTGISVTGGSTQNLFKNKICNLESNNASGTTNGILVSGGTTVTVANNIIGDLRTPSANATNPLNGINITGGTTINVYYNTIHLSGTSSAALFGSSAISVSTAPTVTLNNNLFINNTTPKGAGLGVAHRRSTTTLTSYAASSNRNDFFASTIFSDGATTDATFAAYQTRVGARDANSISLDPLFLSTSCGAGNFLHIDPTVLTAIESGGANIAGFTDDFDGDIRQGNGGYAGTGTAPDMGADEFETAVVNCSTASGGTISPATAAICAGRTYSMAATGFTTGTGITYQWKVSSTSGGPYNDVSGGTGATTTAHTTGALTAGTYYYVLETTCAFGPIVGLSNELVLTVNATPIVSVTPASATYCFPSGPAVALAASGASTYSWSPATGLSATTGANVNATPSSTTTYTILGTDVNGCTATRTVAVTATEQPSLRAISASPNSVCVGNNSQLSVTVGNTTNYVAQATTYLFETPSGTPTISGTSGDDAATGQIPLPFNFAFFGQVYSDFVIYSNGFIQLGTGSGSISNYGATIPTAAAPNNIIAGVWDDLNITGSGSPQVQFFTNGTAPNRVLIIEYRSLKFYNATANNGNVTFQIKLFETSGRIEVHVQNLVDPTPSNHYIGIENATGTAGVAPAGRNPFTSNITTPEAWAFIPSGGTFTYNWSPTTFLNNATISNPLASAMTSSTNYMVTASVGGCSVTSSISVTVNSVSATSSKTDVSCSSLGTATASPTGLAPYNYLWSAGGQTTSTATGLAAGMHSVTVTDANTCTTTTSAIVASSIVNTEIARGAALNFNGSNTHVSVPNSASLNLTTALTIEFWLNPTTVGSRKVLVHKADAASWDNGYGIAFDNTTGKLDFYPRGWSLGVCRSNTVLVPNQMVHVAATYDGTVAKIYLNGILDQTFPLTGAIPSNALDLFLGATAANSNVYDGAMDELRIWNLARTEQQIRENMHLTAPTCPFGMVAYYQMNEGVGSSLADKSSNGNVGTLVNATWIASGVNVGHDVVAVSNSQTIVGIPMGASLKNFTSANLLIDFITHSVFEDYTVTYQAFTPNSTTGINGTTLYSNPIWTINKSTSNSTQRMNLTFTFPTGVFATTEGSKYRLYNRPMHSAGAWTLVAAAANVLSSTQIQFTSIFETGQFMVVKASEAGVTDVRGKMYNMSAANDYIQIGNMGAIPADWTTELWFKPNTLSNFENLLHSELPVAGASNRGVRIELSNNFASGHLYVSVSEDDNFRPQTIVPLGGSLAINEWHHLAVVGDRTNNRIRAYLNGTLVLDNPNTSWPNDFPNMVLGRGYRAPGLDDRDFKGSMDEVRFWTSARTQPQIRENMHLTLKGNEAGLLSYYQFNTDASVGTANGVKDAMGNNHGTTMNMAFSAYVASEVAVAGGVSQRMTISGTGNYNFATTGTTINFGTSPNGELVVSRLQVEKPTGWESIGADADNEYFVIWNYGTNLTPNVNSIVFNEITNIPTGTPVTDIALYKRGSRAYGPTWGTQIATSSALSPGYAANVTFSGAPLTSGFSQLLVVNNSTLIDLPIELLAFDAKRKNANEVELTWKTGSELNNKGFFVERMLEGETTFSEVAWVDGKGTTSLTSFYELVDMNAATSTSYYRLHQIDFDGTESFSEIRAVRGSDRTQVTSIDIYPVPVRNTVNVRFGKLPLSVKSAELRVLDAQGRILIDMSVAVESNQIMQLEQVQQWPAGVYFLHVRLDNGTVMNQRFSKVQ